MFKKKSVCGYLRFLYRCLPSISSAFVNPASISLIACSGVSAILHIYSGSASRTIARR